MSGEREFYLSSSILYKILEFSRSVIELKLEFIGTPLGPNKLQTAFPRWGTCVFLSIFTCEGHAAILCLYKQHSPHFGAQYVNMLTVLLITDLTTYTGLD